MKIGKAIKLGSMGLLLVLAGVGAIDFTSNEVSAKSDVVTMEESDTVLLRDEVNDASVGAVIKQLRALDQKGSDKPIYLFLDTPGGDIQAGLDLIQAAKSLHRPVNTITSFAASMGFQIAQNLNDRLITENGVLMSHHARGGVQGEFGGSGKSQLDSRYSFWLKRLRELDEKTVSRTKGKQTLKSYQESYENELWLNGQEAVDGGYADRVVGLRCGKSLSGSTIQTVNFLGLEFKVIFSKCPLQVAPEDITVNIKTNKGMVSLDRFLGEGGILGIDCALQNARIAGAEQSICSLDRSVTIEKIESGKEKILYKYSKEYKMKNIGTRQ